MEPVVVRYCSVCRYRPRAARVAERLRSELDVDVTIVEGGLGEFSIWVGRRRVTRKRWFRAFPQEAAVVQSVRRALQHRVS